MRASTLLLLVPFLLAACETTTRQNGVDASRKNAIVQGEVTRKIGELRFQHGAELVATMQRLVEIGEPAMDQIRAGAKCDDRLTRASLAWVMGTSNDRRYIPDLRALLSDGDVEVRYESAAALVELGDSSGFAVLVQGLADGDIRNRYKCFESLHRATGQDFGYRHDAAPDERRTSVARWLDWLEGLRANAL